MANSDLFLDILLVTGAAFVGGYAAQLLRLPTIIGFLATGIVIGPNTPGPAGDVHSVELAAELGVILLMFGLGIQVSFRELIALRRIALGAGAAEVLLSVGLSLVVGRLLGLALGPALLLGFLVSVSSTVVALKVLESRGETGSLHGRAVVAVAIFQDLAVVIMILVLPSLAGGGFSVLDVGLELAKGAGLVGAVYVSATALIPAIWRNIAFRRSRELSLLASLTLAVGLAAGSSLLGLSVAFGAFLAGLAVSESEFGFQTLSELVPLRDVFATVFFVAIGMLIVPSVLVDEPEIVIGLVLLVVVGKGLIATGSLRAVGLPGRTAMLAGATLAQVGEFSFVLARAGIDEGVISSSVGSAFLLGSAITILLSPGVVVIAATASETARKAPRLAWFIAESISPVGLDDRSLNRHVIIGGFGRTGRALARSLGGRRLPFVVVDSNPYLVDAARTAQVPFIFGDIASEEVQLRSNIRGARLLALTFDDDPASRVAVGYARALNPRIDIVARSSGPETHGMLREMGAMEVVDAEFEASLEFVRLVLHRFGVEGREIAAIQASRRSEHYRTE